MIDVVSALVSSAGRGDRGVGCTHDLAGLSHRTIDLASLQTRHRARRLFA